MDYINLFKQIDNRTGHPIKNETLKYTNFCIILERSESSKG